MKKAIHSVTILLVSGFLAMLPVLSLPAIAEEAPREASKTRALPVLPKYDADKAQVETIADNLEYKRNENKVIGRGNVVVRHLDTELTADYAEVDTQSKKAYAKGHVVIFEKGAEKTKADEIYYDFGQDTGSLPAARYAQSPWYGKGEDIRQINKDTKVLCNGTVTSCNMEVPYYHVLAKEVTIYEGEKMVAWNVTIYLHGIPVFWLPFLIIPLNMQDIPFSLSAGHNSRHGYYIYAAKGFTVSKEIGGKARFDWRSKRGVGGGLDFGYNFKPNTTGLIKTYWTEDHEAPVLNAENPFQTTEDRDRGRLTWLHRTDFSPHSNLLLRYNRIADEFFLQDFFEDEFRSEIEPQSFITWMHNSDRYGLLTHFERHMNRYEALVERMPEIRADWKRQAFLPEALPGVYYESQASYSQLSKRFGRSATEPQDATRADSYHQWSRPVRWGDVKFLPQIDLDGTYFSRALDDQNDKFRAAAGWRTDLRTHYYKTYSTTFNRFGIEVNKLRHIVEPSLTYAGKWSTVSDETLIEFDHIDRIDDSNIVTLGLQNRLQTKRVVNGEMRRVDFVSLNTYLSYETHPDGMTQTGIFAPQSEPSQTFSNLTTLSQEVILRPYSWLRYELRTDYDMRRDQIRVSNQDLIFTTDRYKVLFGHRFTHSLAEGGQGGNQFVFDGRWTINKLWDAGGYIRWDGSSGGRGLEEWQLSAKRSMACGWVLDFGYNVRDSSVRSQNKTLYFNLYLTPLPFLAIRNGGNRASFAAPLIGETVAGSGDRSGGANFSFSSYEGIVPPPFPAEPADNSPVSVNAAP